MNLKNRIIALVAATCIAVPAIAVAKHSVKGKPEVTFKGRLNSKLVEKLVGELKGVTNDVKVIDDDKDITIDVGMASVKTDNATRDGHFQERIAKGQRAVLKVSKDQISGKSGGNANGQLTLNGQTKPVSVKWSAKPEGDGLKVEGSFNIKYTEWYDGHPDKDERRVCQTGVCVEPDITISANLSVSK